MRPGGLEPWTLGPGDPSILVALGLLWTLRTPEIHATLVTRGTLEILGTLRNHWDPLESFDPWIMRPFYPWTRGPLEPWTRSTFELFGPLPRGVCGAVEALCPQRPLGVPLAEPFVGPWRVPRIPW